jgi:hypothetical protein
MAGRERFDCHLWKGLRTCSLGEKDAVLRSGRACKAV